MPPIEGDSNLSRTAGVTGTNSAAPSGFGVLGTSVNGEGVHGDTGSGVFAAVAGVNSGPAGQGNPSGVFGKSANGEGVHGETTPTTAAAVAGFNFLPNGTGAGVFGISVARVQPAS